MTLVTYSIRPYCACFVGEAGWREVSADDPQFRDVIDALLLGVDPTELLDDGPARRGTYHDVSLIIDYGDHQETVRYRHLAHDVAAAVEVAKKRARADFPGAQHVYLDEVELLGEAKSMLKRYRVVLRTLGPGLSGYLTLEYELGTVSASEAEAKATSLFADALDVRPLDVETVSVIPI